MFKAFMGFLFFLAAISIVFAAAYIVVAAFIIIGFIASLITYNRTKNLKPSPMVCPHCGQRHIRLRTLQAGSTYRASGYGNAYPGVVSTANMYGRASARQIIQYRHEAECQDCGYVWNFLTADDVFAKISTARTSLVLCSIFLFALGGFTYYMSSEIKASDEASKAAEVTAEPERSGSVWAEGPNDISDFKYYLDDGYVYLKEYNGNDEKVRIAPEYVIEGKTYTTADTIEDLFVFSRLTSAVIPEGIKHMPDNIFNGSDVKYLYIPASLQPKENSYGFWEYLHDCEKIYYGGTKEEWAVLTNNTERSDIDVVEIVYNADPDRLK